MRSFLALGRDLVLFALVFYCLLTPTAIGDFLCASRLSEIGVLGLSAKSSCADIKFDKAVNAANAELKDKPPEEQVVPVSQAAVQAAKEAEKLSPGSVPDSGWIFLGKLASDDATHPQWAPGNPQTVRSVDLPVTPGTELTIIDDTYIRTDALTGSRAGARVVSVARVGERVKVERVDPSHAVHGGPFLWALVSKQAK